MQFFEDEKKSNITVIRSPAPLKFFHDTEPVVFLAGSIEQGTAEEWQLETINLFSELEVIILDPRRDNWGASIIDDFENLSAQVTWELTGLEEADIVLMHFDKSTKSPISLLELGLLLGEDKLVVVSCSPEFYRYGNVKITCDRYNTAVYEKLDDARNEVKRLISEFNFGF